MTPTSIPKKEQENVMSSFWMMLKTCESNVDNSDEKNPLEKRWVEQWFQQWNRLSGENHEPIWVTRERDLGLASAAPGTSNP